MAKQHNDPTFLGLPPEIRVRIYTQLLVDEDTFCDGGDGMIIPHTYGGVLIRELWHGNYNPAWTRTSYLTPEWDPINPEGWRTTYYLDSTDFLGTKIEVSLQLFYVCRQIYKEASHIFYSKNRFYVDTIESMIPFLQDRPPHVREHIATISIPMPYGAQREEDGDMIPRHRNVDESSFADVCLVLSTHPELLADVKQLDLRVWDYYGEEQFNLTGALNIYTLRLSTRRVKQLASIAEPKVLTLSFFDWHGLAMAGPEGMEVFEPLPDVVHRKIKRLRDDHSVGEQDPGLDKSDEQDSDSDEDDEDEDDDYDGSGDEDVE